jgi:glutamate racemase
MIGIFDSGVGGLSIYKACKRKLPHTSFIYFSDHGHFPYGEKTSDEIKKYAATITQFLIQQGVNLVVVACNAATISSIQYLRSIFPIPFVGTEPAVKPASLATKTKKIAVLLTNAASAGPAYQELVSKWNNGVQVFSFPLPKLVQMVEENTLHEKASEQYILDQIKQIRQLGIDTIVLGCTHFIFLKPFLKKYFHDDFTILDPTEGVSNQVKRLYDKIPGKKETNQDILFTSGNPAILADFVQTWLKLRIEVKPVNIYE